jgi:hypothetical protein
VGGTLTPVRFWGLQTTIGLFGGGVLNPKVFRTITVLLIPNSLAIL